MHPNEQTRAAEPLQGAEHDSNRTSRVVRSTCGFLPVAIAMACGGAPDVDAVDVDRCLSDALGTEGWSEVPLSQTGTVYGVDFGPNSVLLYIEPDGAAVTDQISSIRDAEIEFGNTAPEDRVILRDRGNVLVSWANEPTPDQRALVERCVGFS